MVEIWQKLENFDTENFGGTSDGAMRIRRTTNEKSTTQRQDPLPLQKKKEDESSKWKFPRMTISSYDRPPRVVTTRKMYRNTREWCLTSRKCHAINRNVIYYGIGSILLMYGCKNLEL